jgi:hypothetical protein
MTIVRRHAMGGVEMQYVSASIQDRVLFVVRSVLEQNSINADVHPESRLIDIGPDSMDIVAPKPSSILRLLNPRLRLRIFNR